MSSLVPEEKQHKGRGLNKYWTKIKKRMKIEKKKKEQKTIDKKGNSNKSKIS